MKAYLTSKLRRHWHKCTIGGSVAYFLSALIEGNHAAAVMLALVVIGGVFHLGDVE
jgi:hypothetical protein